MLALSHSFLVSESATKNAAVDLRRRGLARVVDRPPDGRRGVGRKRRRRRRRPKRGTGGRGRRRRRRRINLPPIGLGCWSWGGGDSLFWGYDPWNDEDLREVFRYAIHRGRGAGPVLIRFRGNCTASGRSETLPGEYSRSSLTDRTEDDYDVVVVVATKFAALPWRTTPESIVKACEGPIGLCIGFTSRNAHANEAYWYGMAMAYERGLIRAVGGGGVSNYGVRSDEGRVTRALARRGRPPHRRIRSSTALLYQHPEKISGWTCCHTPPPLAIGLLSGKYGADDATKVGKVASDPQLADIIGAMRAVAEGHSDVAINWCIAKGTTPIPGARTLRQVRSNYGSLDWTMSDEEVKFLDGASRGFSYIDIGASPFPRIDKDTGLIMFDS
ncbi:hypothetical protein ACHAW5_010592 [Stephanodiscus triporus]|uniref:NADP-dependent oxidoreductase domain-containing protein n=1 Tax=Stephanodiscus triporus TaxID=2934178 RepID=A0ABD3P2C2_9STRA